MSTVIGVYAPLNRDEGNVVALGDSGGAAYVSPLPDELTPNIWQVAYLDKDHATVAAYFEGMPSPDQAIQEVFPVAQGSNPGLGGITYPANGEGPTVNVNSDLLTDAQ